MDALTLSDFSDTVQTVIHEVGYQSWTKENLWVLSEHENIEYFTTRWDALCPYIEVTSEMLEMAPKPFVVYAVPPKSQFGAPIKDRYGLVNALSQEFWADERRTRKFRELDKQFRNFMVSEQVVDGKCWRCGNPVVKKNLKQWFFKITDYADEILDATDDLDWTEMVKIIGLRSKRLKVL